MTKIKDSFPSKAVDQRPALIIWLDETFLYAFILRMSYVMYELLLLIFNKKSGNNQIAI